MESESDTADPHGSGSAFPELAALCRSALHSYSGFFHGKEIRAGFYPYIGLTHTIRRRGAQWIIRISDHCRHAPPPVLNAIVILLASKLLKRTPPPEAVRIYEKFRHDSDIERMVRQRRLQRGRKRMGDAHGRFHSLDALYRELNRDYFHDQVEVRRLGWGARSSWRRLGHYDPVHHTITISPVLDTPAVPKSVLSFLLYHEMLHTLFDETEKRHRKRYHTVEFRRAERAYPGYTAARRFLDEFCRNRRRQGVQAPRGEDPENRE